MSYLTAPTAIAQAVTPRLYPLRYHEVQNKLWTSPARFCVVPAGRRSGKTERAKRHLLRRAYQAIGSKAWQDPRFFAPAPTRDQAKAIFWNDLKAMVPVGLMARRPSESELTIFLIGGVEIVVVGLDKPERIEGRPWDGGIIDEIGNTKPGAWPENIRPALSDRLGWCWLIGVPEGRNHYYDLHKYALGDDPEWDSFTWPSSDILPASEIAAARRQLDDLVFQQEYEASFINFTGRAYYNFLEATHAAKALAYNDRAPLAFCFDFNVEPGVSAVLQEQVMPGQYERDAAGLMQLDKPVIGTGCIGEVWIPRGSNTPAVCRKLLKDWGKHQGDVICYGDATGGAQGSAKVEGSDWDLIKRTLRAGTPELPGFGDRVSFKVRDANPAERSRVNAMNTRIQAQDGTIRFMVDPAAAPHVVRDFEGTRVLEGGSGELDKKSDRTLTHISDAVGYYVEREFPIVRHVATITPLRM